MPQTEPMPTNRRDHECWVVTNGAAGNERQALALAEYLGLPVRAMVLEPRPPWSWAAPRLLPGGRLAWRAPTRRLLSPPWPRVVIGCGRAAALCTRVVRKLAGPGCSSVQILDPRIAPRHWNVVVAPEHDGLSGRNVLTLPGSLNGVDDAWLDDAREAWAHLADLPRPRLGVLLGGPRHDVPMDTTWVDTLADALLARQHRDGGSIMLLASRRTPPALFQRLRQTLDLCVGLHWADADDGTNPYPGALAWADRLVVTPDSVNMLSEACATGRPVHTLVTTPLGHKLAAFHTSLRRRGLLHDIDAITAPHQPPLRATRDIANLLRQRLGLDVNGTT